MSDLIPSPTEYTVRFPTENAALGCIDRIMNSVRSQRQKMKPEKYPTFQRPEPTLLVITPKARLQDHRIMPKIKMNAGEVVDIKYEMVPIKKPKPGHHFKGYAETHPDRYDVTDFLACVEITLDHPEIFKDGVVKYHGHPISMGSMRYKNFLHHGCKCVKCGLEGAFFLKQKSHKSESTYHMNLWAIGKRGELVLMTRDHIIPKSKGGPNTLENMQPMCGPCNWRKGNKMPEPMIGQ